MRSRLVPARCYGQPCRRVLPTGRKPARVLRAAVLAGLLFITVGCTPAWVSTATTPTPTCAERHLCWTITPFCGPAVTPTPQPGSDVWYQSAYWPQNLATLAGFQPLALTGQPQGDLEWNKVILVVPSGQPALLHIGYQSWRRIPMLGDIGPVGFGPNPRSLLAIEETTDVLDPLARLEVGAHPAYIAEQYATTVGGAPATVYHIATHNQAAPANAYQAIEILWHVGRLTVRLLAASRSASPYLIVDPGNPQTWLDNIGPSANSPQDADAFWLGVAGTLAPFTGCR